MGKIIDGTPQPESKPQTTQPQKRSMYYQGKYLRNIAYKGDFKLDNRMTPLYHQFIATSPQNNAVRSSLTTSEQKGRNTLLYSQNFSTAMRTTLDSNKNAAVSEKLSEFKFQDPLKPKKPPLNPNVQTRLKVSDSKSGALLNMKMPSYEILSRISSDEFLKSFKQIGREVKSQMSKSRIFKQEQSQQQLLMRQSQSKIPDPGYYEVYNSPNKSRNFKFTQFNTSSKITNSHSKKEIIRPDNIQDNNFSPLSADKPQKCFYTLSFEKQISRDQAPILYSKEVVNKLNKHIIKQDQLANDAVENVFEKDDKSKNSQCFKVLGIQIVARNMIQQPLVFNADEPKLKGSKVRLRMSKIKRALRDFAPEKGPNIVLNLD